MKASLPGGGLLNPIKDCYIIVPISNGKDVTIEMQSVPEISDSKAATYSNEPILGRSQPQKTFSHSEDRIISMQIQRFTISPDDTYENIIILRALESAVYPRDGVGDAPFLPPVVCKIKCGRQLADNELCVVLRNYDVKFPTDVAWDETTLLPYRIDISLTWETVYTSRDLPGQDKILGSGG